MQLRPLCAKSRSMKSSRSGLFCSCTNPKVWRSSCTSINRPCSSAKHLEFRSICCSPPTIPRALSQPGPGWMDTKLKVDFVFGLKVMHGTFCSTYSIAFFISF